MHWCSFCQYCQFKKNLGNDWLTWYWTMDNNECFRCPKYKNRCTDIHMHLYGAYIFPVCVYVQWYFVSSLGHYNIHSILIINLYFEADMRWKSNNRVKHWPWQPVCPSKKATCLSPFRLLTCLSIAIRANHFFLNESNLFVHHKEVSTYPPIR